MEREQTPSVHLPTLRPRGNQNQTDLREKIDHLLSRQWERLVEIQQVQLELMTEITRRH
jgi:hypothetical protein